MKCKISFCSLLLLLLSVLHSPAPTVNFSAPPFNPAQFIVDAAHNNISILGSSNTISSGVYPVKITNLTGTNYFSIDSTGVPNGYVLLATNGSVQYFPSIGNVSSGLTNVLYTNAGASDTYVIGQISYLKTNSFSGSGGGGITNLPSGVLTNFDTRAWTNSATGVTNSFAGTVKIFKLNSDIGMFTSDGGGNVIMRTLAMPGDLSVSGGDFTVDAIGRVVGDSFTGTGTGLTDLDASQITIGLMSVARISTNTSQSGWILTSTNGQSLWEPPAAAASSGITALTGDVTASGSGSVVATLANIPTSTPMAGSLFDTAIVAPATPASGKGQIYEDSTSKNLAIKNDAGVINHGIQTRTATTRQWIRSIADDGSSAISQPAFTDISGTAASAQLPLATSSSVGGVQVDGTTITASGGIISAVPSGGNSGITNVIVNTVGAIGSGVVMTSTNATLNLTNTFPANFGLNFNLTNLIFQASGGPGTVGNGVSADLNNDSMPDLIFTRSSIGFIFSINSGGTFTSATSTGSINPLNLGVADFNSEGTNGIAIASAVAIQILTNNGAVSPTFSQLGSNYVTATCTGFYVADFNGDGKPDMIASSSGKVAGLWTNNGAGIMVTNPASTFPTTCESAFPGCVADFNNDGSKDLVLANSTIGFTILTNNGTGLFTTASTFTPNGNGDAVAADVNNDGKMDLVIAETATGRLEIFTNTGNSSFVLQKSIVIVASGGTTTQPSIGDFNGDGLVDVLVPSSTAGLIEFTNAGLNSMIAASTNLAAAVPLQAVVGDYNKDGRPDVATLANAGGGVPGYLSYNIPTLTAYYNGDGSGLVNGRINLATATSSSWLPGFNGSGFFGTLTLSTNFIPYITVFANVALNGNGLNVTNTRSYTTISNPTNQYTTGVNYVTTNKAWIVGSFILNPTATASAGVVVNFTNNGLPFSLQNFAPAGIAGQSIIPFSFPLSTNAGFSFTAVVTGSATVGLTNVVRWENQ